MKVKRMGITETLRRIWLFSANKIKISDSVSRQPTQLIVEELSQKITYLFIFLPVAHRQDDRQTLKYSDKPFGILSEPKSISRKKVRN
jgi:hypothetical protein